MIQLRLYTPEDYPLIVEWWKGHGVPETPQACVPALGRIATVNGKDTFAAWVSMDNSCGLCFLIWPVSNPEARARDVVRTIGLTIDHLKDLAKGFGYHTMLGLSHSGSLTRHLEKLGFTADSNPLYFTSTYL